MKVSNIVQYISGDTTVISSRKGTVQKKIEKTTLPSAPPTTTDKVSLSRQSASAPSTLTYTGHGMLEVYPANLSISYVVGHEQRHAQHNRMKALSKGENLQQSIRYSVSFSNGKLIASGGVTEATFTKKRATRLAVDMPNISVEAAGEVIVRDKKENTNSERRELSVLGKNKENLEEKIRNLERTKGINTITLTNDPAQQKKNSVLVAAEKAKLKQQLGQIEKKIATVATGMAASTEGNSLKEITGPPGGAIESSSADNITMRNLSDTFANAFRFTAREAPPITRLNGARSAITVNDTLQKLAEMDTPHPVETDITFNPKFLSKQVDIWSHLRENLSRLRTSSMTLSSAESFNIHVISSSDNSSLTAATTIATQNGSHRINISQTALPHKIVSDIQTDTFQSLGLSGTIKVNGYAVSIETTDSLHDIKNKINFGEDINNNGTLDLTEDLNGNGSLDIHILGKGEARVIVFEDIDLDKIIDPSEDINGNNRIDGGSSQLGISAAIENNQLVLTSLTSQRIELTDDNDLLLSLGVFTTDAHSNVMLKHSVSQSQTATILNQEPRKASLTVDNVSYARSSNTITDIIPQVELSVKKSSSSSISLNIKSDVTKTVDLISEFVKHFNDTISFINDQLSFAKTMEKDSTLQRIRTNLVKNTTRSSSSSKKGVGSISQAGIKQNHTAKNTQSQVSLTSLLKKLKAGLRSTLSLPSKGGSNSLFSRLNDLGIQTKTDDTLSIDTEQLTTALKNNPVQVFSLFSNNGEGVAKKLNKQLNKLLNNRFGTIVTQQSVIGNILKNPSTFEKIRKNINTVVSSSQQSATTSAIIE